MLKFGNIWQNFLTVAVLIGFGFLIYQKLKGGDNRFKNIFSKIKLKGGKNFE